MNKQQMEGLKRVLDYHVDAAAKLASYAYNADMNKRDSKHYKERARFHTELIDVLHSFIHAKSEQAEQKFCDCNQGRLPCSCK